MAFKVVVTTWKSDNWRASAVCPFTGSFLLVEGESEADAKRLLTEKINARVLACCIEPPRTTTWTVEWDDQ